MLLCLGCLLICDYGYDSQKVDGKLINRDTFRAYRAHQPVDPLKEPGTADLTADVDFDYIRRKLSSKANIFGTVTQAHFLKSMGAEVRLQVRLTMRLDIIIDSICVIPIRNY